MPCSIRANRVQKGHPERQGDRRTAAGQAAALSRQSDQRPPGALYRRPHAGYIVGWPKATGEGAALRNSRKRADQPEFRLSHAWREGDVIVWDNRAVLHRATYYDAVKHKRFMQRTHHWR